MSLMASSRQMRKTWCRRCGAYISAPPGARSVRCALCHTMTHVERRQQHHGGLHQAVCFIKGLLFGPPSPPPSSGSMRAGDPYRLPASYPRVRGKKRALLVGITYSFTKYELKGTVNDVNCMAYLLRERFGFPGDCILALTQEEKDPYSLPTKDNLRLAMRWLVEGCTSGDSLVFHFSGHGVQKLDNNGDEVDGYDEALCPQDFEDRGVILDDEINETIVRPLGAGVKLHAIIDTCHRGTILDLPYLCRISRCVHHLINFQYTVALSCCNFLLLGIKNWVLAMGEPQPSTRCAERHQRRPGDLVQRLRGQPNLRRHDSLLGPTSTGAMTYSFIKAVESEPGTTYGRLLSAMRATIRDNGGESGIPGPIGSFFRRVITFSSAQEPQLCASEAFDIYRKPFIL